VKVAEVGTAHIVAGFEQVAVAEVGNHTGWSAAAVAAVELDEVGSYTGCSAAAAVGIAALEHQRDLFGGCSGKIAELVVAMEPRMGLSCPSVEDFAPPDCGRNMIVAVLVVPESFAADSAADTSVLAAETHMDLRKSCQP